MQIQPNHIAPPHTHDNSLLVYGLPKGLHLELRSLLDEGFRVEIDINMIIFEQGVPHIIIGWSNPLYNKQTRSFAVNTYETATSRLGGLPVRYTLAIGDQKPDARRMLYSISTQQRTLTLEFVAHSGATSVTMKVRDNHAYVFSQRVAVWWENGIITRVSKGGYSPRLKRYVLRKTNVYTWIPFAVPYESRFPFNGPHLTTAEILD